MKKFLLFPIALGFFFVCWKQVPASTISDKTIRNEISVSPGEKLVLDLETGGSVAIHGWDKNAVSVRAEMNGENAADCEFQMNKIPGGVRIRSVYKGKLQIYSTSFHFDLKVPQKFNVVLQSSGGDVKIVQLDGEMEGTTGGGEIYIEDSKGNVNLSTGGGEINIIHSHLNGDVSTGGGDVHFDDVSGNINGTTGSGSVTRNKQNKRSGLMPAKGKEQQGKLRIEKAGGEIYIDDAPNGITANTGGGDIRIGSARHFVSVQTGGGDVVIEAVDGGVEATTGSGDVRVKVIADSTAGDHDIDISSGTGDITLIVPSSFSMDVDLKIGYTKEARGYDIISDFALNKRSTNQWSAVEGTPRKYIYGTASIAGGKNRIRIATVNGNIFLKKG